MPRQEPQPGVALAIRDVRIEKGLTQEELAGRSKLHLTWVGRIEGGKANPSWGTVRRIAQALGITLGKLAELAEQKDRELAEGDEDEDDDDAGA